MRNEAPEAIFPVPTGDAKKKKKNRKKGNLITYSVSKKKEKMKQRTQENQTHY